uniref:uncharacterized protein LOC120338267 isoform X1 n=1 Tax=Styela clava TaxID=7725 RepID=UPI00193AA78C|nr:uncharacterized protein LOC120338267 isoform X1 [Styela clava]
MNFLSNSSLVSSNGIHDVKNLLRSVEWSTSVQKFDRNSSYPMIVKPTAETAATYNVSEDPILLHHFWVTQRLTVQSLEEEGAYVVGPQLEISSEYNGTFQYRNDQKGNQDVHMFHSVKEISMSMPERVFPQERLVVYPVTTQEIASSSGEKTKSLVLQPTDQLIVIEKKEVYTVTPSRFAAFSGKPKYKFVAVPCVAFMIEMTKEVVNLPLSTKGKFSTLSHIPSHGREYSFKDIIDELDLPINLITCRNCPQTLLDEHFIRPGMRLRLTAVEEHEVILGISIQENVVEFAAEDVEFILPKHLETGGDKDQEIAYQTALQRFLMECQIKNSPVNIKDYQKSIRSHISRVVRPTKPKALSQTAANRVYKYNATQMSFQNGMPAIALLSTSNNFRNFDRRSSHPSDAHLTQRHSMPLPAPPQITQEVTPPLPPRNSRSGSNLRVNGAGIPKRPLSARLRSLSPIDFDDFPTRPPPPPPNYPPERPKAASMNESTVNHMSGERIWESLDESCLKKLREEKGLIEEIERNDSVFENNATEQRTGLAVPTSSLNGGVFHLSESTIEAPRRSVSPEFTLSAQSAVPSLVETEGSVETDSSVESVSDLTPTVEISKEVSSVVGNKIANPIRSVNMNPYENVVFLENKVSIKVISDDNQKAESLIVEIPEKNENMEESSKHNSENAVSSTQKEINAESANQQEINTESAKQQEINAESAKQQEINAEAAVEDSESQITSLEISISSTRSSSSAEKSDEDEPNRSQNSQSSTFPSTSSTSSSSTSKSGRQRDGFYHVSQFSVISDDSNPLQHVSFACNYVPSPRNWIPPYDLSGMSVSEVSDALRYIGMNEDTVEWFRAEKVDGHLLCAIENEVLTQHFRLTPFQQKKMVMFLKGWRPKLK